MVEIGATTQLQCLPPIGLPLPEVFTSLLLYELPFPEVFTYLLSHELHLDYTMN